MNAKLVELLSLFDELGSPAAVIRPKPDELLLSKLQEAVSLGLIRAVIEPTPTSGLLWFETLCLTDSGRVCCGLPPLVTAAPMTKPTKAAQPSLF